MQVKYIICRWCLGLQLTTTQKGSITRFKTLESGGGCCNFKYCKCSNPHENVSFEQDWKEARDLAMKLFEQKSVLDRTASTKALRQEHACSISRL